MGVFGLVWQYLRKYVVIYTISLIVIIGIAVTALATPLIIGNIVSDVFEAGRTYLIWRYVLYIFGVVVARDVLRYFCLMGFEHSSQNVLAKMRIDMYEKLQHLDFDFYDNNKVGDIMTRMTGDMDAIRHFVAWTIYVCIEQLVILIAALVVMFRADMMFAGAILLIFPLVALMSVRMFKEIRPAHEEIRHRFSRLNSVVQENISGNRIVKAFAKEEFEIEKFDAENENFRQSHNMLNKTNRRFLPWIAHSGLLLTVYVMCVGGIFVINGVFEIDTLITLQMILWMIVNPLMMIPTLLNDVQRFGAAARKVNEVFEIEPKVVGAPKPYKADVLKGKVTFENVSFNFENVDTLSGVSFVAEAGQTVGIIGPTGSGKSTLINMISRFYDPDRGKVRIDDVNIRYYDVRRLRANIATAHQDVFLFSDTIEQNIAYGSPKTTLKRIQEVAEKADAHEFISKMPDGYDTIVGERGVGLSGGQKQRIALARALLQNPAILILDDTTSAVDMETEKFIFSMLKGHYDKSTTFVIAHRISSIMKADLILVMDGGKIIERGTHDELIKLKGYYHSVFENQCGDFNSEDFDAGGVDTYGADTETQHV